MDVTKTDNTLELARSGIQSLDADPTLKATAVSNLECWLTDPQFADARPHLEWLVEQGRFGDLFDAFYQQVPFGTGGRRARVGFGTNRLNPFTVGTSIQGHCLFLKKQWPDRQLSVVVGYDVRVFRDLNAAYANGIDNALTGLTSRNLAQAAAGVYAANGIKVWFNAPDSERYLSTPELSFAIRHLAADGGLNISASHNHPDDNGAKIYNAQGGQEIPPLDEEMAKIVENIESLDSMPFEEAVANGLVEWIPRSVHESYVTTNIATSIDTSLRSAKILFTPLHGTGWSSVGETLTRAGFQVECFDPQSTPDGQFPTVPFRSPNPEVPESLLLAAQHAQDIGADVVLAADPDADRLGMMVPDPNRGWVFINGNQIGTLLADYAVTSCAVNSRKRPFFVTTTVTSSMIRRIAEDDAVQCVGDLGIGFKYIADVLRQVEDSGSYGHDDGDQIEAAIEDFVLGVEESHGYLVTSSIRDKDAAGAAVHIGEIVSRLKSEGTSVPQCLDRIYARLGYVANILRSTVMEGAAGRFSIEKLQKSLREDPPDSIGGLKVRAFIDRWDQSRFGPFLSETDRTSRDLLTLELENDVRIVLRPSGTEPKTKCYVEACGAPMGESASLREISASKAAIDELAQRVARAFLLEMLSRIGVMIPVWALDVSDLVALRWKRHFGDSFFPELLRRLDAGETGPELEQWIDRGLEPYGSDGRLLVRSGVTSYLREESPSQSVRIALEQLFAS